MRPDLERLFRPASVAFIGASKDENKSGATFPKSLITSGFAGPVYPVNPKETDVLGLKSYPSIRDVPGDVDLAYIMIPSPGVPQAMAECAQKGVKFVVIHSAGFGEVGAWGKDLEARTLEAARRGNIRFVGPNCMGIFCPRARLNTVVPTSKVSLDPGPVAMMGQSGWATENVILSGEERGLTFSTAVSCGNQSDLDTVDYLEYFASDPETRVIAAYIEGVKRPRRFLEVVARVAREKPVILWKSGRTKAGARAVASHTGSLAGDDTVMEAAFAQVGVLRAQGMEELLDLAAACLSPYLPSGKRVGVLVEAGGGASNSADACEASGLEVPVFPDSVQQELRALLGQNTGALSSVRNPVDLVWAPRDQRMQFQARCLGVMAPHVDAFIVVTYHGLANEEAISSLREARQRLGKPIMVVPGHTTAHWEGVRLATKSGLPAFAWPDRAGRALAGLYRYARYRGVA